VFVRGLARVLMIVFQCVHGSMLTVYDSGDCFLFQCFIQRAEGIGRQSSYPGSPQASKKRSVLLAKGLFILCRILEQSLLWGGLHRCKGSLCSIEDVRWIAGVSSGSCECNKVTRNYSGE
jgi:hypothetical protein